MYPIVIAFCLRSDLTESCHGKAVRNGMPVLLLSAGQAGATAPASIAGAVAQALSEVIAGLIYVNCKLVILAFVEHGHLYRIYEQGPRRVW